MGDNRLKIYNLNPYFCDARTRRVLKSGSGQFRLEKGTQRSRRTTKDTTLCSLWSVVGFVLRIFDKLITTQNHLLYELQKS